MCDFEILDKVFHQPDQNHSTYANPYCRKQVHLYVL